MALDRRRFLHALIALAAAGRAAPTAFSAAAAGRLGFSTLGCPQWTWIQILDFAVAHGFAAIELRGLQGEMDLPKRAEFAPGRLAASRREAADRGLHIVCLGSSARMEDVELARRRQHLDDGKRFIDLAARLGAPYVRVFGDRFVPGVSRDAMIDHVASGLRELGDYARRSEVTVVIESHGDFVDSPTLKRVLTKADSPAVALLWDAHHTFVAGKEDPAHTVAELGAWMRHTHLKDSRPDGDGRRYVLTGEGEVPVRAQVQALARSGYEGYYSFEWEKMWHPTIEEPEVAIPHYAKVVRGYLAPYASR